MAVIEQTSSAQGRQLDRSWLSQNWGLLLALATLIGVLLLPTPETLPVMSFSIAETELATMNRAHTTRHYAAWNYFQNIDREENRTFLARLREAYGTSHVASDPMEAAYTGVHLWALAARDANSIETDAVRTALRDQSFPAPQGVVYVDPGTQHTWKMVRVGRMRSDGQFDIVWESGKPVRPAPYPAYRLRAEWDAFLQVLYGRWGGWANPGAGASRSN